MHYQIQTDLLCIREKADESLTPLDVTFDPFPLWVTIALTLSRRFKDKQSIVCIFFFRSFIYVWLFPDFFSMKPLYMAVKTLQGIYVHLFFVEAKPLNIKVLQRNRILCVTQRTCPWCLLDMFLVLLGYV